MALPVNVSFGTVTGRFLTATADSPTDPDRDPEGNPATDLKIVFTPNITPAVVRDASSSPPTIFALAEIPATVGASGDLIGADGQPGIRLVATTGTTIDPSGWTWKVRLSSPSFPALEFSFSLDPGQSIDLATVVQVPASPGATLPAWLQAVQDANAAADRAEAAAAAVPVGDYGPFHGARLTAYGHSFGQVQDPPNVWAGALYPARLRDLLHADTALYGNRTTSGATMEQIASTANSNWIDGSGGLVTLMGNQNSVGTGHGDPSEADTFRTAVRWFLATMQGTTGAPPTVLVIKDTTCTPAGYARYSGTPPTDADVIRYNGYLDEVIAEFPPGWILTADPIAEGWDPVTMTCPDGQHPNEYGMATITAACLRTLAAAPYRAGLNRGVGGTPTTPPTTPTNTVTDSFDRADNADTLGTAETGQVWIPWGGTFGISSNAAYLSGGGGNSTAVVDAGIADVDMTMTLADVEQSGGMGPVWRATDENNFFLVDCYGSGPAQVYRYQSGGFNQVAGLSVVPKSGDVFRVVATGDTHEIFVNGTSQATFTDAFNDTATKHGFRISSQGARRIDSFSIA